MRAIRVHEFGGPEVMQLEEVPDPVPGEGEVRVRVRAAGVNPIDWKVRAGHIKVPLPWTPGVDVSGTLDDGTEVFGKVDLVHGSYAQICLAKATQVVRKPASLDHANAAAIPLAALTAYQGLFDALALQGGQTLLILGGAGGIGTFAIQLARWRGARVLATARNTGEANHVRALGAEPIAAELGTGAVDAIFDLVGGDLRTRAMALLSPGGAIASTLGAPTAPHGIRAAGIMTKDDPTQLSEIARLAGDGTLKVFVDQVLPLAQAAKAHQRLETGGVIGKIVLAV